MKNKTDKAPALRCEAMVSLARKWANFADQHDKYAEDYEAGKSTPEFLADAHRLKAGVFRM